MEQHHEKSVYLKSNNVKLFINSKTLRKRHDLEEVFYALLTMNVNFLSLSFFANQNLYICPRGFGLSMSILTSAKRLITGFQRRAAVSFFCCS